MATWKDWGEGKWGRFRNYQAKKEDAVFEQWDNSTEPNTTDWLKVSEVVSRTQRGVVNDSVDVTGVHSSILLDKQQFYPVAKFVNATVNEATYVGFEAYESLEGWSLNQGNISDCIVTGDAHTGESSLQLKPQFTLKRQELSIPNVSQKYILSGWLKTDADFETDEGKVEAKLQFYQGNTPVGNPIVVEIEGTNSKWAYTSDGYEGSGYFNGNIAKNSINYGNLGDTSRNYDYQYQYDNLGRLQVAQNSQDEEASLGVGQPTTYDINGNIETLKRGDTTNEYEYIQNTDKVNAVSNESEFQAYTYDANGNVKTASHRHISEINYDPLTQLRACSEISSA